MVRQRKIRLRSNLRIPSLSKAIVAAARLAIALCWCGADQPHALQPTSPGGSDASELSGKIAAAGLKGRRGRTGSGKDNIGGKAKNKTPVRSNEKEKRSWGNDKKKITKANPILRLLPPVQRPNE